MAAWNAGAIGRCFSPGLLRRISISTPGPSGWTGKKRSRPAAVAGSGPALEVPRQQEDGLQLADDRALEAEHDVVEPLVV